MIGVKLRYKCYCNYRAGQKPPLEYEGGALSLFLFQRTMLQRRLFSSTKAAADYYKITLKRSTIGLSKDVRDATKTLGLFRLHQTSYKPVNSCNAGLILKLKEIVKVELIDHIPTKEELSANKPPRGYTVVGSKF